MSAATLQTFLQVGGWMSNSNGTTQKTTSKGYLSIDPQPVFFGGEHTSTDRFGTVDGAFVSGVQAALWAAGQLHQVSHH